MRTLGLLLALFCGAAPAAPKAELWPRWAAHDDNSQQVVDHADWDAFLQQHVRTGSDGINRIAYGKVAPDQRARLEAYLEKLQAVKVTALRRDEQRAYWINLYNAATVQTVIAHYPVDSILKIGISPGIFTRGPWGAKLLHVEGEAVALDDIEHRILRPIWKDPRTHYSVNCASLGCPNLASHAWTAAAMETMLEQGARDYVNHPRGAQVQGGKLVVSSIYEWFKADFGGDDAGVIGHLRKYAAPGLARDLAEVRSIDDDRYDWALNDLR